MAARSFHSAIRNLAIAAALGLAVAVPARAPAAAPPQLDFFVACTLGTDCWVVNHVDLDPGPGVRDYACGRAAYDGHKGTDIAVRDRGAMEKGVAVSAAAAGEVAGVRDGMEDFQAIRPGGREAIKGRECGNGVLVRHGDGWTAQYCHLRKGSVRVRAGDKVAAGQMLGFVGHSGLAEFPHVHLEIAKDGRPVDPWVGTARAAAACGPGPAPLWKADALAKLAYRPTAIHNAGFAPAAPKAEAVRDGLHTEKALSKQAPAVVAWAEIFWVKAGDKFTIRIKGPDGATVIEHASRFDKDQARRFAFAGSKRKGIFWELGTYRAEFVLERAPAKDAKGNTAPETYRATREVAIR